MGRLLIVALLVPFVVTFAVRASKVQSTSQPRISVELRLAGNKYAPGLNEASVAGSGTRVYVHRETLVNPRDILRCLALSNAPGHFVVEFAFTSDAAKRIAEATKEQDDSLLALIVDGDLIGAQPVNNIYQYWVLDSASKEESDRIAKSVGIAIVESLMDDRGRTTVEIRLAGRGPAEGLVEAQDSMTFQAVYLSPEPIVANKDIVGARVVKGFREGIFEVELTLTEQAGQRFAHLSETEMGAMIADVIGGRVVSSAYIIGELGARPHLFGDFSKEQAELIADAVNRK